MTISQAAYTSDSTQNSASAPDTTPSHDPISATASESSSTLCDLPYLPEEVGFDAEIFLPALFLEANVHSWSRTEVEARLSQRLTPAALRSLGMEVHDKLPRRLRQSLEPQDAQKPADAVSIIELGVYLLRCRVLLSVSSEAFVEQDELDQQNISTTGTASKHGRQSRRDVLNEIEGNLHILNRYITDLLQTGDLPDLSNLRELEDPSNTVTADFSEFELIDPEKIPHIIRSLQAWHALSEVELLAADPVQGTSVDLHHFALYLQHCHAFLKARETQGLLEQSRRDVREHYLVQLTDSQSIREEVQAIEILLLDMDAFVGRKLQEPVAAAATASSEGSNTERRHQRNYTPFKLDFPGTFSLSQLMSAGFELNVAMLHGLGSLPQSASEKEGERSYTLHQIEAVAQASLPENTTPLAQCKALAIAAKMLSIESQSKDAERILLSGSSEVWLDTRPPLAELMTYWLAPFRGDSRDNKLEAAPLWAVRAYFRYCLAAVGSFERENDGLSIPLSRLVALKIFHPALGLGKRDAVIRGELRYKLLRNLFAVERLSWGGGEASDFENGTVQQFILANFYDPRLPELKAHGFPFFDELRDIPHEEISGARSTDGQAAMAAVYLSRKLRELKPNHFGSGEQTSLELFLNSHRETRQTAADGISAGQRLDKARERLTIQQPLAQPSPRVNPRTQAETSRAAPARSVTHEAVPRAAHPVSAPASLNVQKLRAQPIRLDRDTGRNLQASTQRFTAASLRKLGFRLSSHFDETMERVLGAPANFPPEYEPADLVRYYEACSTVLSSTARRKPVSSEALRSLHIDSAYLDGESQLIRVGFLRADTRVNLALARKLASSSSRPIAAPAAEVDPRLTIDPEVIQLRFSHQLPELMSRAFGFEIGHRPTPQQLCLYYHACHDALLRFEQPTVSITRLETANIDSSLLLDAHGEVPRHSLLKEVRRNLRMLRRHGIVPDNSNAPTLFIDLEQVQPLRLAHLPRDSGSKALPAQDSYSPQTLQAVGVQTSSRAKEQFEKVLGTAPESTTGYSRTSLIDYYRAAHRDLGQRTQHKVSRFYLERRGIDYSGLDSDERIFQRSKVKRELFDNWLRLTRVSSESLGDSPAADGSPNPDQTPVRVEQAAVLSREDLWRPFNELFEEGRVDSRLTKRSLVLMRELYTVGELKSLGIACSGGLVAAVARSAGVDRYNLAKLSLLDVTNYYIESTLWLQSHPEMLLRRSELQTRGIDFTGISSKENVFLKEQILAEYTSNIQVLARLAALTNRDRSALRTARVQSFAARDLDAVGFEIPEGFWTAFASWRSLALDTRQSLPAFPPKQIRTEELILYFEHVLAFARCQHAAGFRHLSAKQVEGHSIPATPYVVHKQKGFIYSSRLEIWAERNLAVLCGGA